MMGIVHVFIRLLTFIQNLLFQNKISESPAKCENSLDPDQDRHYLGPDPCTGYQQTTKLATNKELVK